MDIYFDRSLSEGMVRVLLHGMDGNRNGCVEALEGLYLAEFGSNRLAQSRSGYIQHSAKLLRPRSMARRASVLGGWMQDSTNSLICVYDQRLCRFSQ